MTARDRAKLLARGRPVASGLWCPLIVDQAAEIGAVPADEFLSDPTKLANGLGALHQALGGDVIVTASGEAALLHDSARADAAVEATRRLSITVTAGAIAAALPGPSCGEDLLPHVRAFLGAGAHLILLVESEPLADGGAWRAAVTTIANVTRFHQAALVAVLATSDDVAWAPRGTVVAVPEPGSGQGLAWRRDPATWQTPPAGVPLVTTLGPAAGRFAEVRHAMKRLTR